MGFVGSNLISSQGTISRAQWWTVQGLLIIIAALFSGFAAIIDGRVAANGGPDANVATMVALGIIFLVVSLFVMWMNFAAAIKRYRDRGKSWVWALIIIVPVVGYIAQIIECGFFQGRGFDNEAATGVNLTARSVRFGAQNGVKNTAFNNAMGEVSARHRPSRLRKKEIKSTWSELTEQSQ